MTIDLIQSNIINCETYSNFIIKHDEQYMYQTNGLLQHSYYRLITQGSRNIIFSNSIPRLILVINIALYVYGHNHARSASLMQNQINSLLLVNSYLYYHFLPCITKLLLYVTFVILFAELNS